MKFIFMLLILFVLTDPVLADPVLTRPVNNTSECLNMYRTYMDNYGASKFIPDAQMLNFIGRCLPDDSVNNYTNTPTYNGEPQYLKHLQIIDDDKMIITPKA